MVTDDQAATPAAKPGAPHMRKVDPKNQSVVVRWTAPADDGGSDITSYRVQVTTLDGRQVGTLRGPAASRTT